MSELTSPQVALSSVSSDGELQKSTRDTATWYKKVRLMRKQPTVKLARLLVTAVLESGKWGVETKEGAPEGAKDFIREQLFPMRSHILSTSYKGCSDFGWQPFEKVIEVNDKHEMVVKKLKPLLQDITTITVDEKTGAFTGFINTAGDDAVTVSLDTALLINLEVEGTDWYGIADMEAVELAYDNWTATNTSNAKYDKKLAGAHWIIHYPPGNSKINGVETDNFIVAEGLLKRLEGSGSFIVPRVLQAHIDDLNKDQEAWKIELKSADGSTGAGFIDRMKYIDSLFCRALGLPERSIIEGQFGTKAEAGEHGNFAITNVELRHQTIIQQINWHLVNQLLRLNYGAQFENTVYLTVAPLVDAAKAILQKVYETIMASPEGFATELDRIDTRVIREKLGIPTLTVQDREALDEEESDSAAGGALDLVRDLTAA